MSKYQALRDLFQRLVKQGRVNQKLWYVSSTRKPPSLIEVAQAQGAMLDPDSLLEWAWHSQDYGQGSNGPITASDLFADEDLRHAFQQALKRRGWLADLPADVRSRLSRAAPSSPPPPAPPPWGNV